jgi:hypothetical protein
MLFVKGEDETETNPQFGVVRSVRTEIFGMAQNVRGRCQLVCVLYSCKFVV